MRRLWADIGFAVDSSGAGDRSAGARDEQRDFLDLTLCGAL
jgi:hypothetical protein